MRQRWLPALILMTIAWAEESRAASLFSKAYQFKPATLLEIGADVEAGIRLDSVRFLIPAGEGGRLSRAGDTAEVEVAISNTGTVSQRVGIAVALLDEEGRLLGVASGGDRMLPLKIGRQATYTLTFSFVRAETPSATRFQISVETNP